MLRRVVLSFRVHLAFPVQSSVRVAIVTLTLTLTLALALALTLLPAPGCR